MQACDALTSIRTLILLLLTLKELFDVQSRNMYIQQLVVFNYCRNLCEFPLAYVFFLLPNWWYLLRVPVALFQNTEKIKPEKQGSVSNQMFSKNSFVTHPWSFCSN